MDEYVFRQKWVGKRVMPKRRKVAPGIGEGVIEISDFDKGQLAQGKKATFTIMCDDGISYSKHPYIADFKPEEWKVING